MADELREQAFRAWWGAPPVGEPVQQIAFKAGYDAAVTRAEQAEAMLAAFRRGENHYTWFMPDPAKVGNEWLADFEAKLRESLTDPFVHDMAQSVLPLIARLRQAEAELSEYPHNELLAARKAQREAEAQVVALREALHGAYQHVDGCDCVVHGTLLADTLATAEATRKRIEREAATKVLAKMREYMAQRFGSGGPPRYATSSYDSDAKAALEAVCG